MQVNILAVGDVVGESGLRFLRENLNGLRKLKRVDFAVVNGENAAGVGLTPEQADAMLLAGADVVTLGNHTFGRRGIAAYLEEEARILRPANYAQGNPGRGWGVYDTHFGRVCVISLQGRFEMPVGTENPFLTADAILHQAEADVVLVDFHAEATSEKQAMGYYLDGRASAVWGTHTHVQTSDGGVLPGGTGFITDAGMTGPAVSVLGIRPEQSIARFLGMPPERQETAPGPCRMECVLFTVDTETGRCSEVEALRIG